MAGYNYVSQIADRATKAALKNALDEIAALRNEIATLRAQTLTIPTQTAAGIDAQGLRLTNLGAPTSDSDALTVGLARQMIQAEVEGFGI